VMNVFVPECKLLYQDVLKVYNQLRTVWELAQDPL
jgi:hypothetical protein